MRPEVLGGGPPQTVRQVSQLVSLLPVGIFSDVPGTPFNSFPLSGSIYLLFVRDGEHTRY